MREKGKRDKGEGETFDVTVKVSGDTLQQVMTVRGDREKVTGRITPIAELVREAIRFWYKRKEKE